MSTTSTSSVTTTSSSMSSSTSSTPTTSTTTSTSESSTSTTSSISSTTSSTTSSSISSSPTTSSTSRLTTTSQTPTPTTTAPTTTISSAPSSSSTTPPTTTPQPTSVAQPAPITTTVRPTDAPSNAVFSQTTITSVLTTTSNGQVVTITEVSVSQTLSPNKSNNKDNSFFQNTGAVAGVFVVVGLAAASILLWILFALRRRRRTQRLEHDTAVSATLAAAGFHRTPLDDDDDNENANGSRRSRLGSPEIEMHHRTSSGLASTTPSGARTSAYMDSPHPDDPDAFNPYRDYVVEGPAASGGNLPPSAFYNGPYRDRTPSSGEHAHNHSASGSYEPLLAAYYRQGQTVSSPALATGASPPSPPSPPPRNPLRLSDAGRRSPPLSVLAKILPDAVKGETKPRGEDPSVYSAEGVVDDRLDPGSRKRMNVETDRASQRDPRDEEDYSRPVLGVSKVLFVQEVIITPHVQVRNLPTASEASQEF
ncbi:hypothetical protein H0H87_000134 [Tephrocybe sp. NHM501043]|nr:hypothetical protein H0H87_000134 [Tephrocybe sp. NHM501043]